MYTLEKVFKLNTERKVINFMSGRREDNVSRKEIELYKIQRKDNASNIQAVAMAARNAGMTYGQYVAMQYAKENCIRRHGVK